MHTRGGTKVGLQLLVCETQSLLYYYLLITVLFFHMNNCKSAFAHSISIVLF